MQGASKFPFFDHLTIAESDGVEAMRGAYYDSEVARLWPKFGWPPITAHRVLQYLARNPRKQMVAA